MNRIPNVKEFTFKPVLKASESTWSQCCNGQRKLLSEVKGEGGIKATLQIYGPGFINMPIYLRVKWLAWGRDAIFYGGVKGGTFGGVTVSGTAEGSILKKCEGTCYKFSFGATAEGVLGVSYKAEGKLYVETSENGKPDEYGCEAEAQVYASIKGRYGYREVRGDCPKEFESGACFDGASVKGNIVVFCNGWDRGFKVGFDWKLLDGNCK